MRYLLLIAIFFFALPAQSTSWSCYSECMSGGGKYPAECNRKCSKGKNSASKSYNNFDYIDHSCYTLCLSKGKLDNTCKADCPKRDAKGNPILPPEDDDPVNSSSGGEGNSGSGDFGNVDYKCFKQCRFSGDSFDTCQMLCGK